MQQSVEHRFSQAPLTQPPEVTSNEELARILAAQQIEVRWWGERSSMQTTADIEQEIEEGRAVKVEAVGKWFKVSANTKEEFRVLETETAQLLEDIAAAWGERLVQSGLATEDGTLDQAIKNPFLVISSLARTVEFQEELKAKGFPAADGEDSTHTKLGAFDIAIQWFSENRPELLAPLVEVLQAMRQEERINDIEEPEVGAMHIARNPNFKETHH